MPHLLVDENFPAPATQALRAGGVDVMSVAEQVPGAPDEAVLALACAQRCWLVTFDSDYGELLFGRRMTAPPAVLLLREPHYRPAEPAEWLLPLLSRPEEIEGYFCVWRHDGMPKRPLLRPIGERP